MQDGVSDGQGHADTGGDEPSAEPSGETSLIKTFYKKMLGFSRGSTVKAQEEAPQEEIQVPPEEPAPTPEETQPSEPIQEPESPPPAEEPEPLQDPEAEVTAPEENPVILPSVDGDSPPAAEENATPEGESVQTEPDAEDGGVTIFNVNRELTITGFAPQEPLEKAAIEKFDLEMSLGMNEDPEKDDILLIE